MVINLLSAEGLVIEKNWISDLNCRGFHRVFQNNRTHLTIKILSNILYYVLNFYTTMKTSSFLHIQNKHMKFFGL